MSVRMTSAAVACLLLGSTPALAHHPLAGAPMETFSQGLLSGIGHPVLGFDHLFFVLAMGVAALVSGRLLAAPLAYLGAMLAGCAAMAAGVGLPAKEVVIALSLLGLGGMILSGRMPGLPIVLALFAGFGLFHGSAFGDSLAGQEAGIGGWVLAGYLLGLAGVQYALAVGAGLAARRFWQVADAASVPARLSGAVVAGVGAFLTLEAAEGAVFAALGLAG